MSKIVYEVRREFLPVRSALEGLMGTPLGGKIHEALAVLETDPYPDRYGCKEVGVGCFKILVSCEEEEVAILYEVHGPPEAIIDLINIKRVGAIRRILEFLRELGEFGP